MLLWMKIAVWSNLEGLPDGLMFQFSGRKAQYLCPIETHTSFPPPVDLKFDLITKVVFVTESSLANY
jgi:hypothetical protein